MLKEIIALYKFVYFVFFKNHSGARWFFTFTRFRLCLLILLSKLKINTFSLFKQKSVVGKEEHEHYIEKNEEEEEHEHEAFITLWLSGAWYATVTVWRSMHKEEGLYSIKQMGWEITVASSTSSALEPTMTVWPMQTTTNTLLFFSLKNVFLSCLRFPFTHNPLTW